MASYAVGIGVLLMALGGWGYWGAEEDQRSITALIPAFLGVALLLLGVLAFKENVRKHAMHAAATLGALGFIAAAVRLMMGLNAGKTLSERAPQALLGMAILCGLFVGLCINSFIQARRARERREAGGMT